MQGVCNYGNTASAIIAERTKSEVSEKAKSYVLQYLGADSTKKPNPKIRFKDMGSGDTLEYNVAPFTNLRATIKSGGYSFDVYNMVGDNPSLGDDWTIAVDFNDNGIVSQQGTFYMVDSYGALIAIWDYSGKFKNGVEDSILVRVSNLNEEDYDNIFPADVAVKMFASSGPQVEALYEGVTLLTPEGQSDTAFGYTSMGGKLSANTVNGALTQFVYGYPKKQRLPQVYVIGGTS